MCVGFPVPCTHARITRTAEPRRFLLKDADLHASRFFHPGDPGNASETANEILYCGWTAMGTLARGGQYVAGPNLRKVRHAVANGQWLNALPGVIPRKWPSANSTSACQSR